MKLRRAIFAAIIFGGVLVLLLGWIGVFSSRAPVASVVDKNLGGKGQDIVGKAFRTEGPNWTLSAPAAAVSLDGDSVTLTSPVLDVSNLGGKPDQLLHLVADSGTFARTAEETAELKGHIVITLSGPQNAVLKTDALQLNMTDNTGRTDAPLDVIVSTKDGMQTLHGRGAEFNIKQRTIKILSEITMDVTGASILPGTDAPGQKPAIAPKPDPVPSKSQKPPAEPIHVTCDGPAMADGFGRTVELNGHISIEQGDRKLAGQRVNLQFPEAGVEPDRLEAHDNVVFKAGDATGTGDLLVRTRAEGLMLLSGSPAVVTQDTGEIRADRIELNATSNGISVPVKGSLFMTAKTEGASKMSVRWTTRLQFDPVGHAAVFRGNVVFVRDDLMLESQTLRILLDESNRQVRQCFAEGDVRVTGQIASYAKGGQAKLASSRKSPTGGEPQHMKARTLNILFTDQNQLQGFEANGDVAVDHEAQRLTCDKLTGEAGPDGHVTQLVSAGHVLIHEVPAEGQIERTMSAQKAISSVDAEGNITGFVATGRVVVTEVTRKTHSGQDVATERKMRSERMTVTIGPDQKMKTLEATGGIVTIEEDGRTARGDVLNWNVTTGLGVLTGSPVELRQGRSRLYGDQIDFSQEQGSMRIRSAVRVEGSVEKRQPKDL